MGGRIGEVKGHGRMDMEIHIGAPVVDEGSAGGSKSFWGMSLLSLDGLGKGRENHRTATAFPLLFTRYSDLPIWYNTKLYSP